MAVLAVLRVREVLAVTYQVEGAVPHAEQSSSLAARAGETKGRDRPAWTAGRSAPKARLDSRPLADEPASMVRLELGI
jgi:hypothetical protein